MQDHLIGENLALEILKLLEPETNKAMRATLGDVAHKLGDPGASQRAAQQILHYISV